MTDEPRLPAASLVRCAVCQRWIASPDAQRVAARDCVLHFCAACCQEEWSTGRTEAHEQEARAR